MSKNITLLGQDYSSVPAVELPQTNGGMAIFIDNSDTTAESEDVLQGKYFYAANGVKTPGALVDGDYLGYGSEVAAVVGDGLVGYTIMGEATLPTMGTAVAGLTVVGG